MILKPKVSAHKQRALFYFYSLKVLLAKSVTFSNNCNKKHAFHHSFCPDGFACNSVPMPPLRVLCNVHFFLLLVVQNRASVFPSRGFFQQLIAHNMFLLADESLYLYNRKPLCYEFVSQRLQSSVWVTGGVFYRENNYALQ